MAKGARKRSPAGNLGGAVKGGGARAGAAAAAAAVPSPSPSRPSGAGLSDAHLSLVARLAPAAKVKVRRRCGTGAGPRANDGEGGADGADGDDDCAKAEEGARGLEEFFDLLKDTAPEDVRKIDARLRSQTSSEAPPALEGLGSDRIEQVWAVARTLTNVDDELLKVGVALEHLSAASCAWRRMLLATQVAGDLLRRWLWERKVKESNRGRRPDRQRRAARQAREMLAAAAMDPGLPERLDRGW